MAERLNIEIHYDGKCLANAYYHYGGYTRAALWHVKDALKLIDKYSIDDPDRRQLVAIRLLEGTGARLTANEIKEAMKRYPDAVFAPNFGPARKNGMIAITDKEIEETRYWEEHRAVIDLKKKTVTVLPFFVTDEKDLKEYYGRDINEIPKYNEEFNFNALTKTDINRLIEIVHEVIKKHEDHCFQIKNGDILCTI